MTRLAGATLAALLLAAASASTHAAATAGDAAGARVAGADAAAPAGDTSAVVEVVEVHFAMGTPVAITARGDDATRTRAAIRAAFGEIRRLEAILTAWDPDSATSRLNREAGRAPSPIPAELRDVLAAASRLSRETDHAFSVLVGPVVALWRAAEPHDPSATALAHARDLTRADGLQRDGDRAALREAGMRLDLDGIAKGFAADRALMLLRASGVRAAIVDLGGSSMAAFGDAGDGARGWPVQIPLPPGPGEAHVIRLVDEALSASASGAGDATSDGAPAHRRVIVDPRTGARVTRDATAIVVHASATDAEAWSKALLVRGWGATALLARHGGRAMLHDGADAPRCTPRFRNAPGVCKVLRPAAASRARPHPGQEKPSG